MWECEPLRPPDMQGFEDLNNTIGRILILKNQRKDNVCRQSGEFSRIGVRNMRPSKLISERTKGRESRVTCNQGTKYHLPKIRFSVDSIACHEVNGIVGDVVKLGLEHGSCCASA